MNFAGDILNSPYGPLLQRLILGKSDALETKFNSLPNINNGNEGSYPTYPNEPLEGSYPTYPNEPLEGSYPTPEGGVFDEIPKTRTMEFRDANSNGIDDRDEKEFPNSNGSTFIVPSGTSNEDIDQLIIRRSLLR